MGWAMAIDFSVNTNTYTQQSVSHTSSASATQTGAFMGQAAKVATCPMSLLSAAAEEMTFAMDTTDEFELEERKEKKSIEDAMLERVEMYQEMMKQVGQADDVESFKMALVKQGNKRSPLEEAKERFPDTTDAWVALQTVAKELEKDPATPKEVINDIRAAIATLEESDGSRIKAGLISATVALDYADLGDNASLRELYQQNVFEFEDAYTVFQHVQKEYGSVGFEKAMDFLYGALSADIGSDLPSMENVHLEHVHANLGQVRLLNSTHILCDQLLNRWEKVHGQANCPMNSMQLLEGVVGLGKERFLGTMHIDKIVDKVRSPDIEHTVLFLQEFLSIGRQLPPRVYGDEQGYRKVMDVIQQSVDRAIEKEDEWLASFE